MANLLADEYLLCIGLIYHTYIWNVILFDWFKLCSIRASLDNLWPFLILIIWTAC